MRLTHLRLAGFKSFVEPTSVAVPSNLVGVVGPNGCGKSNIIDAVRWVLGESKASELRGESMQDVIFNGSSNRKPASRASVELVFDNAEGRAGGSWNQFAEISVKRVLTRDGSSTYYINQQAVRRRDVQDIFLGTGLGPRAYAIIGQGMIARIIEARPEDLRVFLEEAAGVSKYKERRRETGNRLQDTRDNLTRVEDILRELTGQIDRLEHQAEIARQFRGFEQERQTKQLLLWALRYKEALDQKNDSSAKQGQIRADLEKLHADSVRFQTELIAMREKQIVSQQALEVRQSAWIESNRTVSRLEADLRVMAESRSRLQARIHELESEQRVWLDRAELARVKLDGLQEELQADRELLEEKIIACEEAEQGLEPLQAAIENARAEVDRRRAIVIDLQRDLASASAEQEGAHRAQQSLQMKLDRLALEQNQVQSPEKAEVETARLEAEDAAALLEQTKIQLEEAESRTDAAELDFQTYSQQAAAERQRLEQVQAKLQALEALESQLSDKGALKPWASRHQLNEMPRLLSGLKVESGWEKAVESALREKLDAFVVRDLDSISALAQTQAPERVAFIQSPQTRSANLTADTQMLASLVKCQDLNLQPVVESLLAGCLIADNLSQAIQQRRGLQPGQMLFVPEGHCVTEYSVSLYAAESEQAGRLERKQQIDHLRTESRALEMLCNESATRRDKSQRAFSELKATLGQLRQSHDRTTRQAHDAQLKALRLEEAASRAESRLSQLSLDKAVLLSEMEEQSAIALEAEDRFADLDEKLAVASESLETQKNEASRHETRLRDCQLQVQQAMRARQDQEFLIRNRESSLREAEREIRLSEDQSSQLHLRQTQAKQELASLSQTQADELLQQALKDREVTEEWVAVAREELEQIMGRVSELEVLEKNIDRQAQPLRDVLQSLELKIQAADMTLEQQLANFEESEGNLQQQLDLAMQMEVLPKPQALQAEVTRLANSMQALGAVNLAALDELTAAQERKSFLDQQAQDLIEAMETLEDAIRKIDKETRELLQETFDAVNSQFSRLFPLLFGGGEARLVMSGEEILDAGVQVFAQPPGKKNGTIHLLSGGEKALTATALVFAIFELNPAPFCLLDEVDAPLDDANTERFSNLVRQMSEKTQFLFISHNKIAMEMAQQLIGVTMQEKGVSRIVAVDLASAEKLATETV